MGRYFDGWEQARAQSAAMDRADPWGDLRQLFEIPDDIIYLDGNSLGAAPKAAFTEIDIAAREEWASGLIRSWNTAQWFALAERYGDQLAALVGADDGEVVICDTTSLNLYKALHAGLSLRPDRFVILAEASSFPSDLYIAEGVRSTRPDVSLRLEGIDGDDLENMLDEDIAVVLINHVDYRTGRLRDMNALTAKAHAVGAIVVWDLCHSAGILPVDLNGADADLAVGCTYKYLNGGPGAPAFIFAAKRHIAKIRQPLSGWWGHADPFAFDVSYREDRGIRKFLCGTQPILSFRALKASLDMFEKLDMQALRARSLAMTALFMQLVEESCTDFGLKIITPSDPDRRGGQVALTLPNGYEVMQALIEAGVIGDFRAPNIIRFGFSPLYNSYGEICRAAEILHRILENEEWREARFSKRQAVT